MVAAGKRGLRRRAEMAKEVIKLYLRALDGRRVSRVPHPRQLLVIIDPPHQDGYSDEVFCNVGCGL